MLAEGDWRRELCKPLKGIDENIPLVLYRGKQALSLSYRALSTSVNAGKINKGARFIWERAVQYSPRSNTFESSEGDV